MFDISSLQSNRIAMTAFEPASRAASRSRPIASSRLSPQHLRVALDLAADQSLEGRADVGADVAAAHGQAEHLAEHLGHLVAGQVVHGGDDDVVAHHYSHSIVLGGLLEMSSATLLTPATSLMILLEIRSSTS